MKARIKKYYEKKGLKGLLLDLVFVVLIVLIIVPSTRSKVIQGINQLGIIQPSVNDEESVALTSRAWNWEFSDVDGRLYKLSDFKGKVIFINYWATWCPPCIAEMPSIQNLYEEYGDQMVFIIASNESGKKINEFINDNEYTFPVYNYRYKLPEQLKASSIPTTIVVSKEGEIVLNKSGFAKWDGGRMKKQFNLLID